MLSPPWLAPALCCASPRAALAVLQGHTRSCKLYTAAINACMVGDSADIDAALEIHSRMQASGVEADDLLYGNLIAVAGKAGRFNLAFDILNDMLAGGVAPGQATCSALIFACLKHGSLAAVKRVYSTLKSRGVYPSAAQYNALMEQYARNFRLGEVAMLLQDMMGPAGLTPTVNTYRVLLIACQRTDQVRPHSGEVGGSTELRPPGLHPALQAAAWSFAAKHVASAALLLALRVS